MGDIGSGACRYFVPSMAGLRVMIALLLLALVLGTASGGATAGNRDLTAALAYWRSLGCQPWAKPDTSMWMRGARFNALFGNCRAGDGHDQHVLFLDRARFAGTDGLGTSSEILGIWRDEKTFAFMYVLYRPHDALCCPTGGGKIVRFRWSGKRFRALDRPPRRQNGSLPVGR